MLTVVCVKAGSLYGPEYVNILKDMIYRNVENGIVNRFICLTDDPTGLDGIETIPLPDDLEGWWGKLYMFREGLFPYGERIAYFDLDTIITGRLDKIFAYDGKFAALRDFYEPGVLASGVMLWESGAVDHIWEDWVSSGKPRDKKGDQWWIGRNKADFLQDLFPSKLVSYKKDCLVAPPRDAAVICFHGLPRPHQVEGWVQDFWKIGGLSSAEFDVVCNTELEKVVGNIRYSSRLGLDALQINEVTARKIILCGGGPSLADSLDEIRQAREAGAVIVGMNGSAQWLRSQGILCNWMVMIDSREHNTKFLTLFPADEYFIASQCHPAVFDTLKDQLVTIFHIDIPNIGEYVYNDGQSIQAVGGGSTVGLMSMALAYIQGHRDIHLYGYDSSFRDTGHAYPQDQADEIVEAVVCGRAFKTTAWMVTQTTQFQELAAQLRSMDCNITVHGDGLLPYVAWCTANKIVEETPPKIRAREIFKRLPDGPVKGVEIGVFAGELSVELLQRQDMELTMVDSWKSHGEGVFKDSDDFHATLTQDSQDSYQMMATNATEFAADRRTIFKMESVDASKHFEDESLDFVFIDADHTYEGCKADLHAWYPKVKKGGVFSGHDYEIPQWPKFQVKKAVDEFLESKGLKIDLGDNYTWFTSIT